MPYYYYRTSHYVITNMLCIHVYVYRDELVIMHRKKDIGMGTFLAQGSVSTQCHAGLCIIHDIVHVYICLL
jgi:hypothetical protein